MMMLLSDVTDRAEIATAVEYCQLRLLVDIDVSAVVTPDMASHSDHVI